jgi:hypothetical protein
MAAADSKYNFIKNNEFKESDSDSESVGLLLQEAAFRRHRRRALWPWIAHMIFFASSLSLFVTGTIRLRQSSTSEESIEPLWTREYGM